MAAQDGYDIWNLGWFGPCWHSATWRDQYQRPVKRVALQPSEWTERDLVPAQLTLAPGRKRERPYVPTDRPRKCQACGAFGHFASSCKQPEMDKLVASHVKRTKKAVVDYIDLSNGD